MTYNVFGETLNLAQFNSVESGNFSVPRTKTDYCFENSCAAAVTLVLL